MSFTPVRVAENRVIARQLHHVEIDDGGSGLTAAHALSGQFVQLAVDGGKPGFYAIANAPGTAASGRLELLIKADGETSSAICKLWPGAELSASAVMGKGFGLERAEGRPLLIFCVGSGISAVRSVLEGPIGAQDRPVHLYYGCLDRSWMAYTERFEAWRAAGIHVHTIFDHEPEGNDYTGPRGYVQELFQASPPADVDLSEAAVLLCGLPQMVKAVSALVTSMGVSEDRVLLNF